MQNKIDYKNVLSTLKIKGIYSLTFLGIFISIISTLIPYISGIFINSIVSRHSIVLTLFLLISCNLLLIYLRKKYAYLIAKVARAKYLHLQERYLQKVNSLSPFDLEKFRNGELGMKFFRDIQNVTDILRHFYPQLLEIFLTCQYCAFVTIGCHIPRLTVHKNLTAAAVCIKIVKCGTN